MAFQEFYYTYLQYFLWLYIKILICHKKPTGVETLLVPVGWDFVSAE